MNSRLFDVIDIRIKGRVWLVVLAGVVVSFLVSSTFASPFAQEDKFVGVVRQMVAKYRTQLEELATWCDNNGLSQQAKQTRAWLQVPEPNKLYLSVLREEVGPQPLPDDTPKMVVQWNEKFLALRHQQAGAFFEHARNAAKNHRASLAYELILMAIREDPDHVATRRFLGYQKYKNQWCTRYETRKLRYGQIWHDRFGWLSRSHVKRYEEGKRYYRGRWVSAEQDARIHSDIQQGWDIETEHYTVRTNDSLESGVQLAKKLEELYCVWTRLFASFYATEAEIVASFDGRTQKRRAVPLRHHVVFFRTREQYNETLRDAVPNIEISIGLYVEATHRAYFFSGKDYDERTLLHEATHQLFHESRRAAANVGLRANFWIIEGIAMFMESLQREENRYVLGGFDDARMIAARYRLLHDNFYVPLSELTGYGMLDIQSDKRIATLYSQATGLTHFLVFYNKGQYRDALIAYLSAVYSGRDTKNTLSQLTGMPYVELDRQYRQFLQAHE